MYAAPHLPQPQISQSTSSIPPSHQYQSQMSHRTSSVPQNAYHSPPILTQPMTEFPQLDSGVAVHVFNLGDDPIACLNKAMTFMPLFKMAESLYNKFKGGKYRVMLVQEIREMLQVQGQTMQVDWQGLLNDIIVKVKDTWLDAYDSYCDDISSAKAVLMSNLSNYGSDILSKVPNFEIYQNDMDNQSVQAMQHFEQTHVDDSPDNEITSDSNIIPYSQYLQETQQAAVQDTNSFVQQDSMILSVIEQMSEQMINHVTNWEKANQEKQNESLTAELERYKERVKTFEQRLNIDLSSREKLIDSQKDDMIRGRLARKQQIDSLE
ncbi:hypothetical protein Tco_0924234 [Tanacetum coccineum]|uniref:Uncharacterized protein n=1 Tax=Tanacetum coccineum TaxID=301880 RepID=A0ABQ5D389_9ASTR